MIGPGAVDATVRARPAPSRARHAAEVVALGVLLVGLVTTVAGRGVQSNGGPGQILWVGVAIFVGGGVLGAWVTSPYGTRPRSVDVPPGWQCWRSLRPAVDDPLLAPFAGGRTVRKNVMAGTWSQLPAQWFVVGRIAVTMVTLPAAFPILQLVPRAYRTEFDVGRGDDLHTESAEFRARWRIWSPDLMYAHAVLGPRFLERLLQPDAIGCGVTVVGRDLYAWEPLDGFPETGVTARLGLLTDLVRLVPAHVWRMYGGGAVPHDGTRAQGAAPSREVQALIDAHGGRPDVDPVAMVATREKNLLGRLSLLLFFTIWGIPVGLVLGWRAVRAAREGRATNARVAKAGLVLNAVAVAVGVVAALVAGLLALLG